MALVAAFALTLCWLAFGVTALGCSDDSPQSPAGDGSGNRDGGPVQDAHLGDVSIDDWPDESASSDRIEGGETG
jgi:hypothetical protein